MLSERELRETVGELRAARQRERRRLDPIHNAVRGESSRLYVPRSATEEYRSLVQQSQFNVLPLVITQLAQALYVDGYRHSDGEMSPMWNVWQANRMDARQGGIYRTAIEYGVSYTLVLPGAPVPQITPLSPRRCTALYEDSMVDEWPQVALVAGPRKGHAVIYDDEAAYPIRLPEDSDAEPVLDGAPAEHGLGVCPVVRYLDSYGDLDEGPSGKIEPLLPVQEQLHQTTFSLLMAQHYGAFRQRWVTGMAIPVDESGTPYEPWQAAVSRVWHAEEPDARFGDFAQTDLSGYLDSRDKALLYMSSVAQIPPHNLIVGSGISNISAEALTALEAGHRQDIAEHQTSFGESVEQMMRLCGLAAGDTAAWEDTSAQVVWRDTTPRSLAQVADALGKLAQLLGVPARALWERIPGVTQQDIERWEQMADSEDALGRLEQMLAVEPSAPAREVEAVAEAAA